MSASNKPQYFVATEANEPVVNTRLPVEWLEINAEMVGQRLDNFLLNYLKGVPKGHIYQLIRTGQVRVNKARIKPLYKLCLGDIIRIPPLHKPEPNIAITPSPAYLDSLQQRILYEDNTLLILNKPAGLAVHGGSGLAFGVIEAMRALRPEAAFLELVHRLDRDTSGCLMIAKRRSVLRQLHDLLRERKMSKRYLAVVQGQWQGGKRRVEKALEKNILQSGERMVHVNQNGKAACTWFTPLAIQPLASLMQVEPLTGRTHQIRVHAQYSGHPVIGDKKYGESCALGIPCSRLLLHAASLDIPLAERIQVSAPLDEDFKKILSHLKLTPPA